MSKDSPGVTNSTNPPRARKCNKCPECGFDWAILSGAVVCGKCGIFLPLVSRLVRDYFSFMRVSERLPDASKFAIKGHLTSAVRDATVHLETLVRERSRLTSMGVQLMDEAFSFEFDNKINKVTRSPRIQLNTLASLTKRNEQDGIRLMAMGAMKAIRNLFAHSSRGSNYYYGLSSLMVVDFLIATIKGEEGTLSESRTFYKTRSIPKAHKGHEYTLKSQDRTHRRLRDVYYCQTCSREFVVRHPVFIKE